MLTSRFFRFILFFLTLLLVTSCEFIEMEPLRIESYSPSQSRLDNFNNLSIIINFSKSTKISSVERSFSLADKGVKVKGDFSWSNDNKKMIFTPAVELDERKNYKITLKTTAEDINGNSLEENFIKYIYVTKDEIRPFIENISIGNIISDPYEPIIIEFSEAIPPENWLSSFSVEPSLNGTYTWNSSETVFTFTPIEKYNWNEEYTFKISDQLSDYYYNSLNSEWIHTSIREEVDTPVTIVSLKNNDLSETYTKDDPSDSVITYNNTIKTDESFKIEFNREITVSSIKSYLTFDPPVSFDIEEIKEKYRSIITIKPREKFSYNGIHTLTIKKGILDKFDNQLLENEIYHMKFNNPDSKPPELDLTQIYYNDSSATLKKLDPYDNFVMDSEVENQDYYIFMDLHFLVPDRTQILTDKQKFINSLLDNFSLNPTNSCADITILGAYIDPPSGISSSEYNDTINHLITTGANSIVVRVYFCYISKAPRGVINLSLDKAFSDGSNNMPESVNIIYNKGF